MLQVSGKRPFLAHTAAIIWMLYGIVIVFGGIVIALLPGLVGRIWGDSSGMLFWFAVSGVLLGLIFLVIGLRILKGEFKDTLISGIGTLLFGLVMVADSTDDLFVFATSLLLALGGVLALMGRRNYRQWVEDRS